MSTAPQGWQNPKTNWQAADIVHPSDFNRIEGNIQAIESGSRTLDPSQAPSGNTGSLRQLLDWFANRIRAITGAANWYNAPATTLAATKSHMDATSGIHGATSSATANRIIIRDSAGRAKVAAPSAASDIATKGYVDSLVGSLQSTTRVLAVSDTVMHSALTERSHDGQDEKIVKKFMVNGLGTIRLTFELRSSAGGVTPNAYAKAYGNAVERAVAKSSSTSYEPFSLDVDVFGTTLIEVAIYRGSLSTTVYIRNVRVRYDVAEVGDEGVLLD